MNSDLRIEDKLSAIVKEAIDEGYELLQFMDYVKYAVLNAITEGYIFDDYLDNYDLVEDVDAPEYLITEGELDDFVKTALEKKGLNYDEERLTRYYQEKKEAREADEAPDSLFNMIQEAFANNENDLEVKMYNIEKTVLRIKTPPAL